MATLVFGAVTLFLCVVAPLALHFYRRYQDARLEKMRRVAQLTHAYRLTQRYLHRIPSQYLTRECRLLLLERAIAFLEKLGKETPGSQLVSSKIFRNRAMLETLQTNFVRPPPDAVNTAIEAREAQMHLAEFGRFVEIQARSGAVAQAVAEEIVAKLNWLSIQVVADFYREQGATAEKNGEYRLAIHHFNNAIQEFNKHLEFELAVQGAQACQASIEQNEQRLTEQETSHEGKVEAAEDDAMLLKEWDTLFEEGAGEKKRQLYE